MTTATQTGLFDPADPIARVSQPRVGHHHRNAKPTERAAAQRQVVVGAGRRRQVLEAIVGAGSTGLTRQELADWHGFLIQSVCGRVKELLEGKFVYETTRTRRGRTVLVATERGTKAIKS